MSDCNNIGTRCLRVPVDACTRLYTTIMCLRPYICDVFPYDPNVVVIQAAQKEGLSDDDVTKDFERLFLLEKLCRAQSRIESLDKQVGR